MQRQNIPQDFLSHLLSHEHVGHTQATAAGHNYETKIISRRFIFAFAFVIQQTKMPKSRDFYLFSLVIVSVRMVKFALSKLYCHGVFRTYTAFWDNFHLRLTPPPSKALILFYCRLAVSGSRGSGNLFSTFSGFRARRALLTPVRGAGDCSLSGIARPESLAIWHRTPITSQVRPQQP